MMPLMICGCMRLVRRIPAAPMAVMFGVLCLYPAVVWSADVTRDQVLAETLHPYTGTSAPGVDRSSLDGKVMCGYQGWFNTPDDGANRGWVHWTKHRGPLADGNAKFDLWPDVSELTPAERFATGFTLPDGKPAQVFSSFERATVLRHFQWMQQYGIDGAFVQRFAGGLRDPRVLRSTNTVLEHCREGANLSGRAYAVMYDLSGLRAGQIDRVIDDWKDLRSRMHITDDPAYLHHRGKPLVTLWGVGFSDHRAYTLDDCRKLIDFLKNDPQSGGCSVMLGVPTYWREQRADAVTDPQLHDLLASADVISPWTVGRYHTPADAEHYAQKVMKSDIAWCADHKLDFLPVVFPGFSWHNMYGAPLNAIPRLRGQLFWTQFCQARSAGAKMAYVAMFDEVDEGTAIFKCTNDVPVGEQSQFLTYEGLPSDFYLKLAGQGGRLIRGEIPLTDSPPSASR
jgi:hypothetical protein